MPDNSAISNYDRTTFGTTDVGDSELNQYMEGSPLGVSIEPKEGQDKAEAFQTDYEGYFNTEDADSGFAVPSPEPTIPSPGQSAKEQQKEATKNFLKNAIADKRPFLAKEGNRTQVSTDPRLLESGDGSWWSDWSNSFLNKVTQISKSQDISDIADTQNDLDKINQTLETTPYLTPELEQDLKYRKLNKELELRSLQKQREEKLTKMDEREVSLPFQIMKQATQADEGTGNPFIPSQYGIGEYLRYEFGEDLAGGAFEIPTQMGAALGPRIVQSIGSKLIGSLALAPPWGTIAATAVGVGAHLTGFGFVKEMRERESKAEAGEAYKSKLAELSQQFVQKYGREPTEKEARRLRMSAYQGLDDLRKANMSLLIEDIGQTVLYALPWTKAFGNLGTNTIARMGSNAGSIAANMISEGVWEEGPQYIWQEEYKDGTLQEISDLKDYFKVFGGGTTRSSLAVLGIGEKELMESSEFMNGIRAGAVLGGGASSFNAAAANFKDIISTYKTKKEIRNYMTTLEPGQEKDSYRSAMMSKFMGIGKKGPKDKASDLIYGKDRTAQFNRIMENIKGSKFARDNNISDEEIEAEQESFNLGINILRQATGKATPSGKLTKEQKKDLSKEEIKRLQRGLKLSRIEGAKALKNLSEEEKIQAATIMANLNKRFRDASVSQREFENELSKVRQQIYGSSEDLGAGFVDLVLEKTKLQALNRKLEGAQVMKDNNIPHTERQYEKYIEKLQTQIKDTEESYTQNLDNSKFKAKDIATSFDDQLRDIQGNVFEQQAEKEIHQEEVVYLRNNTEELANRAKTYLRSDQRFEEEARKSAEEFTAAAETESTVTSSATEPGGITTMEDNEGNSYKFYGEINDQGKYKLEQEDGTEIELSEEQMTERGIEAVTKKTSLGEGIYAEEEQTEEYADAVLDERTNRIRESVFGTPSTAESTEVTGEASTTEQARTDQTADLEYDPVQEVLDAYESPMLSNSNPQTVFDNKKLTNIPAVYDGKAGTLSFSEDNQVVFTDANNQEYIISDFNTSLTMKDLGINVLDHTVLDIGVVSDGKTFVIQNQYYKNMKDNPMDAIEEDSEGNPISVTLQDQQNRNIDVTFKNPRVVKDLAYAISLIENTRASVEDMIKQADESFVVVNYNNRQYAVYNRGGKMHVKGKIAKSFNRWVNKSTRRDVLNKYNQEIQNRYELIENLLDQLQPGETLTKEDLQNEIRNFNNALRYGTAEEINSSKSAAELSDTEGQTSPETSEATEPETGGQPESQEQKDRSIESIESPVETNVRTNPNGTSTIEVGHTLDPMMLALSIAKAANNKVIQGIDPENWGMLQRRSENASERGNIWLHTVLNIGGGRFPFNRSDFVEYSKKKGYTDELANATFDLLDKLNKNIGSNTAADYTAEVSKVKRALSEETSSEEKLINQRSREKAEDEATSEQIEGSKIDLSKAGSVFIEPTEPESAFTSYTRGLSNVSTNLGYYSAKDVDAAGPDNYVGPIDKYVSNNDLSDHTVEFYIDFDYRTFWDKYPELEKRFKQSGLNDDQIDTLINNHLDDVNRFDNAVDSLPIKGEIKDSKGNKVGDLSMHLSSYDNIALPNEVQRLYYSNKQEYNKERDQHIALEKKKTRATRIQVLKSIMRGERPTARGITRTKGIEARAPAGVKNRNKKLTDVFKFDAKNAEIGVADNTGIIMSVSGGMPGIGSPGNVFLKTESTVNGEAAVLKLNPSKLTDDHARMLFKSVVIANLQGGFQRDFPGTEAEGATVGDVIDMLSLYGKKTKVGGEKGPESHKTWLIKKQLYVEDKVLHYGDYTLDIRGKKGFQDFSAEEINHFANWAKANKNYPVRVDMLGQKFQKEMTIKGFNKIDSQTQYEEFLIDNNIITTDIRKPYFHVPALNFDMDTLGPGKWEPAEGKNGTEYATKTGQEEQPSKDAKQDLEKEEKLKSKTKTMFKFVNTKEKLQNLPVGTELLTKHTLMDDRNEERPAYSNPVIKIGTDESGNKVYRTIGEDYGSKSLADIDGELLSNDEIAEKVVNKYRSTGTKFGYLYEKEITNETYNNLNNPPSATHDPNDPLNNAFRLRNQAPQQYEKIDIEKELKWLRSKLPKEDVHIVDNLIKVIASGEEAFGQTRKDMIILSRAAEYGTAYHEAFHRISLSLLTPEQRSEVYNRARKKYDMEGSTDLAVEEVLAERFREFMLTENKEKFREPNVIKRFFQNLWNMIRTLFTGDVQLSSLDIESLFTAINQGRFKYARPKKKKQSPILQGSQAYLNSQGYTSDMQRTLTRNLVFLALNLNGVQRVADVGNITFEPVKGEIKRKANDFYDKIGYFNRQAEQAKTEKDRKYNEGESAEAQRLYELYNDVLNDFEHFQSLAEEYLQSLEITRTKEDYLEYEYEGGKGQAGFEKYNKAPYQFDGRKNIRSDIKMMVATLPESRQRDRTTAMLKFVDFTPTWNKVLYDLHDVDTVTELMERLQAKKENYIPYQVLYKRLNENGENTKTQFLTSVQMHKNDFINLYYSKRGGKYRYRFGDAEIQSASRRNVREWGEHFARSDFIDKDNNIKLNKVNSLISTEKDLIKQSVRYSKVGYLDNFDSTLSQTTDLLNEVSIPVDKDHMLYILDQDESAANRHEALMNFITRISKLFSEKGVLYQAARGNYPTRSDGTKFTNSELFSDESVIKDIGTYFSTYNPATLSATILGPRGNAYYKYMANSYMTDSLRKIRKSSDYVDKLKAVVFNQNSYFLEQLSTDSNIRKNFSVDTFSAFVGEYGGDRGRSYEAVNPIEDFLARMLATKNGKLPLPTLADRSSFYYYKGIEPIDFSFTIDNEGNTRIPKNSKAVRTIEGYIKDEQNRIDMVKRQVDQAIEQGDSKHLVEEYHYKFSNSLPDENYKYERVGRDMYKLFKDENGNYLGRGARFNHFDHLNNKRKIDPAKEARNMIRDATVDTIKLASELGVIESYEANNKLHIQRNNFIDDELLQGIAEERYNGNHINAIKDLLANYAVNNIISAVETDKVLLMDPAFYSGSADKVKRSTVLGATGQNLRADFPADHELHDQTTYNTITLDSSIIDSEYYPQLKENYKKKLKAQGYNESQAEDLATKKLSDYRETDQTDAQVFVTPEYYRSVRMRLGEWAMEDEKTNDSLQSDEFDAVEDHPMPPLKLTYFGPSFENGAAVPIYNKMSQAKLDRKVVEGTELEELLDRMELKGNYAPGAKFNPKGNLEKIDQVKFDSAVKVGNRERFQFYADANGEQINDLSKAPVYQERFENLRRQTLTEPHEENHIALGTQAKKVPMYNVHKNGSYTLAGESVNGKQLLDYINKSIGRISDIGNRNLLDNVGIDPDTGQVVDNAKLMNMLREDAIKSNSPNNIIDALSPDADGNYPEFDSLPDRKWIENRVVSMVNRQVIDMMVPGKAFIQMSNFGMRVKSSEDINKFKDKISWLQKAKKDLKFYRIDERGNLQNMEAILSIDMFRDMIPRYDKLTFEEKKQYLIDNVGINNLEVMGYRVPTQGPNSISRLTIVGFLPESYGDTIVLPAEFTALTGSDFDIDKLFAARHNYEFDENNLPKRVPFLTDSTNKPGLKSSLDERIRKYAREEALANEIGDIDKYFGRQIKQLISDKELRKEQIDDLKADLNWIRDYLDIADNERLEEQLVDKQDTLDAVHSLIQDYNQGIKDIQKTREEAIERQVEQWINEHIEEFSQRDIFAQNTSAALENMAIDGYFSILSDDKHSVQVYTPLDSYTGRLKNIAEELREGSEPDKPNAYSLTPRFQVDSKSRYISGKNLIGSFALNNVHHVIGQIADLHITQDLGLPKPEEQSESVKSTQDRLKDAYRTAYDLYGEYSVIGEVPSQYESYIREITSAEVEETGEYVEKLNKSEINGIPTDKILEMAKLEGTSEVEVSDVIPWETDSEYYEILNYYGTAAKKFAENSSEGITFQEATWLSQNNEVANSIANSILYDENYQGMSMEAAAMKLLVDNKAIESVNTNQTSMLDQEIPAEHMVAAPSDMIERTKVFDISRFVSDYMQDKITKPETQRTSLSVYRGSDGEYVSDWMSALISALVDIAKDPYIFDLNVNEATQNVANFLARAGLGERIFYFLPQPVLKDLAYYSSISDKSGSGIGIRQKPGNKVRSMYKGLLDERMKAEGKAAEGKMDTTGNPFDTERLKRDAKEETEKDSEYYRRQLEILDKFQEIKQYAMSLTEAVMASRADTQRYGKNLVEAKSFENKYKKVKQDNIIKNFQRSFDETFLGNHMNNAIPSLRRILKDKTITSTEGFNFMHDQVLKYSRAMYRGDDQTINRVVNFAADEIYSAVTSRFFTNSNYMNVSRDKLNDMLTGDNSVAKRAYRLKYETESKFSDLKGNKLLEILSPRLADEEQPFDSLSVSTIDIQEKWDKDEVTKGWKELLTYPNEWVRNLAKDLITYSFFTSGFNKNINSFFEFMPFEYLRDVGFSDYVRQQISSLSREEMYSSISNNILDEFYRNNWHNDMIVPEIDDSVIKLDTKFKFKNDKTVLFAVEQYQDLHRGYNISGDPVFVPYVKTRFGDQVNLYEYVGYKHKEGFPVYRLTEKLGYSRRGVKVKEYGTGRSIFEGNREEIVNKNALNYDKISTAKRGNRDDIYSDFIPVPKEDNIAFNYTAERTGPSEVSSSEFVEKANRMDVQSKQSFNIKRIQGQKNFSVEEVQNARPDLSMEEAEVLRDMIKNDRIDNRC